MEDSPGYKDRRSWISIDMGDGQGISKQALHINFKLSQSGEVLTLANSIGEVIDSIEFPKQEGDISCAKLSQRIVYMQPTPNRKNSDTHPTSKRTSPPTFSLESGFYADFKYFCMCSIYNFISGNLLKLFSQTMI